MATSGEVSAIPSTENPEALLSEKTAALNITNTTQDSTSVKDNSEAPIKVTDTKPVDIQPSGPIYTAPSHPLPSCKPEPSAALTAEQQKKYEDLLETVKSWTEIPSATKGAAADPINDLDRVWLTRDCLLRYLRATKWSPTEAPKRLLATLAWYREYGVRSTITADFVSVENETGKQVIFGYDNDARPCLYLSPGKQNTKFSERQNNHLVFMLERVIDMMPAGQESTSLLINYKDTSSKGNPPLSQGRAVLNILQQHYPERLGRALISDLPWYVTTFFKLISPFIDPVTKSKMKFNEPLVNHIPPLQLLRTSGGEAEFEYTHDKYWPALVQLCEQRRRDYTLRWEKAGKQIGESEAYLRGGDIVSLDGNRRGSDVSEGSATKEGA